MSVYSLLCFFQKTAGSLGAEALPSVCLTSTAQYMLSKEGCGGVFFFFLADQIYLGSQTFLMTKGRPEEASTSV